MGNYYFVCYGKEDADLEYGPKCAEEAYLKMNGTKLNESDEKPIYVAPGMKKAEREKVI